MPLDPDTAPLVETVCLDLRSHKKTRATFFRSKIFNRATDKYILVASQPVAVVVAVVVAAAVVLSFRYLPSLHDKNNLCSSGLC